MTKKIERSPTDGAIAVTGAAGFVGGVVLRMLAASGIPVHGIARTPLAAATGVTAHGWDPLRDAGPPAPGIQVDAVIDCAAALPSRVDDPAELKRINALLVEGAIDLAARRRGRLVYMSSQSVYGRPGGARIDTDTPLAPVAPYGEAKRDAEAAIARAVAQGRLVGAAVLRLPAVVGPGAHDNFPAAAAATLIRAKTVTVFNPDAPYNAVVDAADLARFAIRLACVAAGFVAVSPATGPATTIRDGVQAIATGLGRTADLRVVPAPYTAPVLDPGPAIALGLAARPAWDVLFRYGESLSDTIHKE
ncbi:NAD-dependent epimerase/dehydratase family protein [Thalassobaculum sp. OXR-137]|uniref:NAD-dependent epimerase/dehydratase family protein n=1 Tax=Thalassobaculum sp. OXR-137 TaxID=3100173 RepID=UPI002AC8BA11|nr:NAD-dependent epimerase/dehydratase family protein [Thalassobaculum sp. OXR-137]WPZ36174.1 NAD-dependent epimerase/dehydratase family protein [Thalassobaculum sp. OXR-137]